MIIRYVWNLMMVLGIAILSVGCNNDIFLNKDDEMPEEMCAEIEGDGGETEFKILTKGLLSISLDVMSEWEQYCTYYDKKGNIAGKEIAASELGKIVYDNGMCQLEISKHGDKLTVRSIENPLWDGKRTIRLDYGYDVKFIYVVVEKGEPMRLVNVDYNNIAVADSPTTRTSRLGLTNNSPSPHTMIVRPFMMEYPSVLVTTVNDKNTWVWGQKLDMPVPMYENGDWKMKDVEGIAPETKYTYPHPEKMTKVEIEVPANSEVTVILDLSYLQAIAYGTMIFECPVSKREISVEFKCTSKYPVDYKIRVEK